MTMLADLRDWPESAGKSAKRPIVQVLQTRPRTTAIADAPERLLSDAEGVKPPFIHQANDLRW